LLGDSIAYGIGTWRAEDALGQRLAAKLTEAGFAVDLHVLAVPGAVSAQLASQTSRAVGMAPDLAVVVVGANDLARLVPPRQAATQLGNCVRALRGAGARVVVATAPDVSVAPVVPPTFRPVVRAAAAVLEAEQARAVQDAGGVAARLGSVVGPRFAADVSLFCADRYHPSAQGYAVIAEHLAPVVLDAARAAGRDRRTDASA